MDAISYNLARSAILRRAEPPYSALVAKDGSTVWAEDTSGKTIASGEAGVDDASVIQSAGNYALSQNGILKLLGEFTINDNILFDGGGTKALSIVGDRFTSADHAPQLNINADTGITLKRLHGYILRDLSLNGNGANKGIFSDHSILGILENVYICNFKQALDLYRCWETRGHNITISFSGDSETSTPAVIIRDDPSLGTPQGTSNNIELHFQGGANKYAFVELQGYIERSSIYFEGNEISSPDDTSTKGIYVHKSDLGSAKDLRIVLNTSYGAPVVDLNNAAQVEIIGNLSAPPGKGIYMKNCNRVNVNVNTFHCNNDYDIYAESCGFVNIRGIYHWGYGLYFVSVTGLKIDAHTSDLKSHHIYLYNCKDVQIKGNFYRSGGRGEAAELLRLYSCHRVSIDAIFYQEEEGVTTNGILMSNCSYINILNEIYGGYISTNKQVSNTTFIKNSGTATFSGDGTTTDLEIGSHGLVITDPSKIAVKVTPASSDAIAASPCVGYVDPADNTKIRVKFSSAPASGSENVKIVWYAEVVS